MYVSVHSQHPSYSAAVRLAKRWLASQMLLSDFIAEEPLELIIASLYLSPAPFTPPAYGPHMCFSLPVNNSKNTAFWDMINMPIIVAEGPQKETRGTIISI